jgi:hypothetical protein
MEKFRNFCCLLNIATGDEMKRERLWFRRLMIDDIRFSKTVYQI